MGHISNSGLHRGALSSLAVAVASLGLVASASAAVKVEKMVAKPITKDANCSTEGSAPAADLQSGKFADLCLALALDGGRDPELGNIPGLGDDPRDIRLTLGKGDAASLKSAVPCPSSQFQSSGGCKSPSQVGSVSASVETPLLALNENLLKGKVFLLVTGSGEAARLGLQIEALGVPMFKIESAIRFRVADGAVTTSIENAPRNFIGIPIEMRRLNLRLWGSKVDHPSMKGAFHSNATDCSQDAVTSVEILSYRGEKSKGEAGYRPTDCETLESNLELKTITNGEADAPTQAIQEIRVPAPSPTATRAIASVREGSLSLPEGFELSGTAASGGEELKGCTDEEFGRYEDFEARCPKESIVGEVAFDSYILPSGAISGPIFLAMPKDGQLLRFFATASLGPEANAARVKVEALADIDPKTGQITAKMLALPPLPFTLFRFAFRGGDHAIVSSPRTCGTREASVALELYSGQPTLNATTPVVTDKGCGDPNLFEPKLKLAVQNTQAGADTAITTTLERPDKHARLTGGTVRLPPGLLGRLGAAEQCPLAAARAGNCAPGTKIGSAIAASAPGPKPLRVPGDVFLTEGIDGDPAGMAIVVDLAFGPLRLGKVVVVGRLQVRDEDKGLNLTFVEVPERVVGVATAIRGLELTLDKPGFVLNATNCAPFELTGTLRSDIGKAVEVKAPYQVTGCDKLGYSPKLEATLTGGAAEAALDGHPGLSTTLTQPSGQSNTKKAVLALPMGISVDATRINRACPIETFNARACPPSSTLGQAKGATPLLTTSLAGPVVMVTVPGAPLPELRIQLNGLLPITLAGKISTDNTGRLIATIDPLPDVPLSRFDLSFNGGASSLLQSSQDLCATPSVAIDGAFDSQSGAAFKSKTEVNIPGCGPSGVLRISSLKSGQPRMDLRAVGTRTQMRSIQLVVPRGMEFQSSAAVRKLLRVSATGLKSGARARVTITGNSILVSAPSGQWAKTIRVRLGKGAVRVSSRLRNSTGRLSFRLNATALGGPSTRSTLRVRPGA